MPTNASPSIRITVLGKFEVACGERDLRASDWPRRKAATLLQYLALHRRALRDEVIELLWPESEPASGANNLYRTLHSLRQTLEARLGEGSAEATLAYDDGVFTLNASARVDAGAFERAAQSALSANTAEALQAALALYGGDLLPDEVYADWTAEPRAALRRLHRDTSLRLAALCLEARRYAGAIPYLTALVTREASDETAQRELIRTYALAGRRHEALRQYQACVQALEGELGVPPEPATAALYQQILSGELAQPALAPARESIALEAGPDASLVGREAEFESLRLWLREAWRGSSTASGRHTILLSGDTGVGKTRLAFEALCAATGAGFTPLYGAAYEQEGQLAYQPFIEAFDRALRAQGRPLSDNPITHYKPLGSSDPQQEHWALFNAAARFLSEMAAHGPLVLLLDDLHAHAFIRHALYEGASRARRTWLHTRAAESLEAVYAPRPAGLVPHVEALAYHYALSDQRERAIPFLMQSGQKAAERYAFEVGVQHMERALRLMDELGLDNAQWRWMILSALGWWSVILADTPRVVACFEQALALPPGDGWQPSRRERASLHRGAVMALITAGDVDAAAAHLQAALAEIDEREDAAEYAHVLYNVAQFHWHRNEYRAAFEVAQRSLAIAERLNDPPAIARAFEMLALACHSLGEWQNGAQYEQQRAALAGPGLDVTEAFDVHL